ncbi:oxidoreductase, FAD-binding domain protein [Leptospira broomii serovar Hurstbridge str. 5399]|uniref:Oxidoreductase, FAD-binding domain protein n=1 Tax=Leptospira broomii serovar Hurstbridge str. 5399 TaxID=1049789 RepID=T0FCG4_9LEPT|nr:FAD-dependent oxidoreductase [Leptospira broomii]EQA45546.1 oxidoreductase, FAD-binding domain protein [Leptospira broomii serovar Hurstbridge str. 5399]
MVSVPKSTTLIDRRTIEKHYDLYMFKHSANESLNFVGGQYIIINSGKTTADGKQLKRAYTILSSDAEQSTFQLLIRRVDLGNVTTHLRNLAIGTELEFSGPWGKFAGNVNWPKRGSALLIATDSGISSSLSLLSCPKFNDRVNFSKLVWLLSSTEERDLVAWVRSEILSKNTNVEFIPVRPTGESWRSNSALSFIRWVLRDQNSFSNFFLSGNGTILDEIKIFLEETGADSEFIGMESFFRSESLNENGIRLGA